MLLTLLIHVRSLPQLPARYWWHDRKGTTAASRQVIAFQGTLSWENLGKRAWHFPMLSRATTVFFAIRFMPFKKYLTDLQTRWRPLHDRQMAPCVRVSCHFERQVDVKFSCLSAASCCSAVPNCGPPEHALVRDQAEHMNRMKGAEDEVP